MTRPYPHTWSDRNRRSAWHMRRQSVNQRLTCLASSCHTRLKRKHPRQRSHRKLSSLHRAQGDGQIEEQSLRSSWTWWVLNQLTARTNGQGTEECQRHGHNVDHHKTSMPFCCWVSFSFKVEGIVWRWGGLMPQCDFCFIELSQRCCMVVPVAMPFTPPR